MLLHQYVVYDKLVMQHLHYTISDVALFISNHIHAEAVIVAKLILVTYIQTFSADIFPGCSGTI